MKPQFYRASLANRAHAEDKLEKIGKMEPFAAYAF